MKRFMIGHNILSTLLAGVALATCFSGGANAGFQWTAPTDTAGTRTSQTAPAPRVQAAPVAPVIAENLPQTANDLGIARAPAYTAGSSDDPVTWNTPANKQAPAPVVAPMVTAAPVAAPVLAAPAAPIQTTPSNVNTSEGVYIPRTGHAAARATAQQQPQQQPSSPQNLLQQPTPIVDTPYAAAPVIMQETITIDQTLQGGFALAEGFGSDLPLVMAIRQIVPTSYGFVFDEGIDLSRQVSWQGGQPWNTVLQNVLNPLQLRAVIQNNVVSIIPAHKSGMMQNATHAEGAFVTSEAIVQNGEGYINASAPAAAPASLVMNAVIQETVVPGPVLASATTPDIHTRTVWTAPKNSTLRSILQDWAARVGVELYWASEYDYPVASGVVIEGSFEEAVQVLLRGLSESRPRPLGRLHPNLPNGPAVLLIETRDQPI